MLCTTLVFFLVLSDRVLPPSRYLRVDRMNHAATVKYTQQSKKNKGVKSVFDFRKSKGVKSVFDFS